MKIKGEVANIVKGELEITDEEAKSAFSFIDNIIPKFVKEGGGLFSDNIKFWRWKNQVKIVLKAKEFLNSNNIEPRRIPLKTIVPLLENASLEEDNEVQEMWAKLLSKYLAGDDSLRFNFITILKEISPIEIRFLDWLYENKLSNRKVHEEEIAISASDISKFLRISETSSSLIIENFVRLGILIQKNESVSDGMGFVVGSFVMGGEVSINEKFILGQLGVSFIKACKNNTIII